MNNKKPIWDAYVPCSIKNDWGGQISYNIIIYYYGYDDIEIIKINNKGVAVDAFKTTANKFAEYLNNMFTSTAIDKLLDIMHNVQK